MSIENFSLPIRVYYEDTDAGGVVYHSNYLNFMERARTEWVRSLGFEQDELREKHNILFVVNHISIDYKKPARFNDQLEVTLQVIEKGRVSLVFEQQVLRKTNGSSELLAKATVKVATIDATTLRIAATPKALREALS